MNDELSDPEVMAYLPEQLWKERGGQLQLTLIHSLSRFSSHSMPHCEYPGDPYSWHLYGHPEINVHPRGELLCGEGGIAVPQRRRRRREPGSPTSRRAPRFGGVPAVRAMPQEARIAPRHAAQADAMPRSERLWRNHEVSQSNTT
jgi:hypothetical protein